MALKISEVFDNQPMQQCYLVEQQTHKRNDCESKPNDIMDH